jgi:hypothetical protein
MYLTLKVVTHWAQIYSCLSSQQTMENSMWKWKGQRHKPRWPAIITCLHSGWFESFTVSATLPSWTFLLLFLLFPSPPTPLYLHITQHLVVECSTSHTGESWLSEFPIGRQDGCSRIRCQKQLWEGWRRYTMFHFYFDTCRFRDRIVLSSWDYITVSMGKRHHGFIHSNHLWRIGYSITLVQCQRKMPIPRYIKMSIYNTYKCLSPTRCECLGFVIGRYVVALQHIKYREEDRSNLILFGWAVSITSKTKRIPSQNWETKVKSRDADLRQVLRVQWGEKKM